jgi:uncharacterized protein DUF5995
MNAPINYDLPQALLAVITDEEFGDPALLARRRSDHQAIDRVLASRVAAEDDELASFSRPGTLLETARGPERGEGRRLAGPRPGPAEARQHWLRRPAARLSRR